mmetsp:Transcript_9636/g.16658  ORF Transcript_9636/g.16658 Transcript_9636/m.16658 type:complete len:272 (-) Transcript_9636:2642-3457(-)
MSSTLLTRPSESGLGRAPMSHMTWANDSPYVLMLSVPHRTTAIDSGNWPSFSAFWRERRRSTTVLAARMAAAVGIACGSRAWMFLPVGSTSGLRMGSPPGPGRTYSPFRARMRARSSLSAMICLRQNWRYSIMGFTAFSSTGKPASFRAASHAGFSRWNRKSVIDLTAEMRPSTSADSFTSAVTDALVASFILSRSSTSSRSPRSLREYMSSMSRPMDWARALGMLMASFSSRSRPAMLTRVAAASSEEGGLPTTWRPIGRRRDSISMSLM